MANQDRAPGTDAVCFTAGPRGIPFVAGVVHAWLASDRDAPRVVAGISGGALSSAALARAAKEREAANKLPAGERESRRWLWFRRYLDAITNEPLKPFWDAIPDPVDYFADQPPVKDLSAARYPEKIVSAEARARDHYYRLVKLGLWLSGLRVSVAEVSRCIVHGVRYREGYGGKWWNFILAVLNAIPVALKILLRLALAPHCVPRETRWPYSPRVKLPLFGWFWLGSFLLLADLSFWILMEICT